MQDSNGNWVVAVEPMAADYQQHWNVQLGADDTFRLINRGTGLSLSAGSMNNACATVTNQPDTSLTKWTIIAH
jgi:hypothetical protein